MLVCEEAVCWALEEASTVQPRVLEVLFQVLHGCFCSFLEVTLMSHVSPPSLFRSGRLGDIAEIRRKSGDEESDELKHT